MAAVRHLALVGREFAPSTKVLDGGYQSTRHRRTTEQSYMYEWAMQNYASEAGEAGSGYRPTQLHLRRRQFLRTLP